MLVNQDNDSVVHKFDPDKFDSNKSPYSVGDRVPLVDETGKQRIWEIQKLLRHSADTTYLVAVLVSTPRQFDPSQI